ncbi:MAG TPA: GTP cyclohydrolase FolE2 [Thermotogota bacterium]|nr:GTP cyclohydrolase FolE2 [Thermotogota bacterium]
MQEHKSQELADLQSQKDARNIPLNQVGVRNVRYPIQLRDREKGVQHTIGTVHMSVDLPEDFRGTHMSRFIEILHHHAGKLQLRELRSILSDMKTRLHAHEAHMQMFFPYVIAKKAPVTGVHSNLVIDCAFLATLDVDDQMDFILEVNVPVQTVCPCSRAISRFGAHNQRANIKIRVRMDRMVWIEQLVEMAEASGSSPIFPLLKRKDEKWVTEQGYENPKFVEDVAREVTVHLRKHPSIRWFEVQVESMESIHDHEAFACIRMEKPS